MRQNWQKEKKKKENFLAALANNASPADILLLAGGHAVWPHYYLLTSRA